MTQFYYYCSFSFDVLICQTGKPSICPTHPDYAPSVFTYQTSSNTKSTEDRYWRAVKRTKDKANSLKRKKCITPQVTSLLQDDMHVAQTTATNDTLPEARCTSEADSARIDGACDVDQLTSDFTVSNDEEEVSPSLPLTEENNNGFPTVMESNEEFQSSVMTTIMTVLLRPYKIVVTQKR